MKIEKLNENKIRITFNNSDLKENNVDIHSFMSNSIESQSLFLNMLDIAERDVGFITDNYKLSIDAIALSNGTYIITVTRIEKENLKSSRVQPRRKNNSINKNSLIYKFSNFDDICNFHNFLSKSLPKFLDNFFNNNKIYKYNENFFLILENLEIEKINNFSSIISEFAIYVQYSDLILHKIKEYGTLLTKNATY